MEGGGNEKRRGEEKREEEGRGREREGELREEMLKEQVKIRGREKGRILERRSGKDNEK